MLIVVSCFSWYVSILLVYSLLSLRSRRISAGPLPARVCPVAGRGVLPRGHRCVSEGAGVCPREVVGKPCAALQVTVLRQSCARRSGRRHLLPARCRTRLRAVGSVPFGLPPSSGCPRPCRWLRRCARRLPAESSLRGSGPRSRLVPGSWPVRLPVLCPTALPSWLSMMGQIMNDAPGMAPK